MKQRKTKGSPKKPAKKAILASRRSCGAKGTGLSHYILMNEKSK